MPTHKLPAGKHLIAKLGRLGKALGYRVEFEYPIDATVRPQPAVDIAWFTDEAQTYPLMIFEVESRASNSIANNALKVLSQDTSTFEKPLFFFHLILSAGKTSRIANLEREFGTHNYRCLVLKGMTELDLIRDVLAQHRRVRQHLDLRLLFCCLEAGDWPGVIPSELIQSVDSLEFDTMIEPVLLEFALRGKPFLSAFAAWIAAHIENLEGANQDIQATHDGFVPYEAYFARIPLYLGLLAVEREDQRGRAELKFDAWLSANVIVGPGFSKDWNDFLFGGLPLLMAVMSILFPSRSKSILEILDGFRTRADFSDGVPSALWALHISAASNLHNEYESARAYLNRYGGVNHHILLSPLGIFGFAGDEDWYERIVNDRVLVPPFGEFTHDKSHFEPEHKASGMEAPDVALKLLTDGDYGWGEVPEIVDLLSRHLRVTAGSDRPDL